MSDKTLTIRVSEEIHRMAKKAAFDKNKFLQDWIENLIKKECQRNVKK